MAKPDKDSIPNALAGSLFLPTGGDGQAQDALSAPVIILQNDPANVYAILEKHVKPDLLSQPDKFWKCVRDTSGFQTWRPRVNGVQLKMLQNARLPETAEEWLDVQSALEPFASQLRSNSSIVMLLQDLANFTASVENWWANRKKGDGNNLKRAGTGLQANGKRPSYADLHSAGMFVLPEPGLAGMVPGMGNGVIQMPQHYINNHIAGGGEDVDGGMRAGEHFGLPQVPSYDNLAMVAATDEGQPAAPLNPSAANKICVTLNVGGHHFETTIGTLAAVEGSYLWKMAQRVITKGSGERQFFVDRNGKAFEFILDYLRGQRFGGGDDCLLPSTNSELRMLLAEARYYKLPGLAEKISSILGQSQSTGHHAAAAGGAIEMTALYLQTGYKTTGAELDDAHSDVTKQLQTQLTAKRNEGFSVVRQDMGTEPAEGGKRNIYYHVLMQKIV